MEVTLSLLDFNFHDLVTKHMSTNTFLLGKDITAVAYDSCAYSQAKFIRANLCDFTIHSLYMDEPEGNNPFAVADRFDQFPILNLFNELVNCLFNTNYHLRIKKGYDKYKLYQLGPFFKDIFNTFFDKVMESSRYLEYKVTMNRSLNKDTNEFIKDYKDCILSEEEWPNRY